MSQHTNIQWADSTCNPTTGCDGCELASPGKPEAATCYAKPYHERRMANALPLLYAPSFHDVRLAPGRMAKAARWSDLTGTDRPDKPWLNGMPRVIFVGDLGDVFSREVPFEYLKSELIDVATSLVGRRHIWMVLTKQSERLLDFDSWLVGSNIEWPSNVWPGVSVTKQSTVARVADLVSVGRISATRFISVEPMLGPIDRLLLRGLSVIRPSDLGRSVQLCIIGGESNQGGNAGRGTDVNDIRRLIQVCRESGIAPFVKQLGSNPHEGGKPIRLFDSHGGDWDQWPDDLRVREVPQQKAGAK